MKQQLVYIHGAEAFTNYDDFLDYLRTVPIRNLPGVETIKKWPSRLVKELGDSFEVFTPSMPNAQNAKYEEWKIWFERHVEYLHDEVILLGWSQGGLFLVKYLLENKLPVTVKALILAAAPVQADDFGGEDGGDFLFEKEFLPRLQTITDKIVIFHSEDDFVVPFVHGETYAAALPQAEFVVCHNKNHFLIEEFPELIAKIKEISGN